MHTTITYALINYIGKHLLLVPYIVDKANGDYNLNFLFDNDTEMFFGGVESNELKGGLESAFNIPNNLDMSFNTNIKRWFDGDDMIITWSEYTSCDLCGVHGWHGRIDINTTYFEHLYDLYHINNQKI